MSFINETTNDNNISAITGLPITLTNDQGIEQQPFTKKDGLNLNLYGDTNPAHNMYSVEDGTYIKKREQPSLFDGDLKQDVYGNTFSGELANKDRYDLGMIRNFEKPTERQYVAPIDEKSIVNVGVGHLIAQRNHIDNIRSEVNKKDNYKGRVKAGSALTEVRGIHADVYKYSPYRDYKNDPDRYFTTVATTEKPLIRPEYEVKFTNRSIFNNNFITNAKTYISDPEKSQAVQTSHRQQLDPSNGRNFVGNNTQQNNYDYKELGYHVYPNEREVTSERNIINNANTYIHKHETGYNKDELGYVDKPKGTLKQTNMYSDLLNPKTSVNDVESRDLLCTYQTDPTKEIISTGREPTLSNVKLMSGADRFNTETKKLDSDYMTQYQTGITNIFSNISTSNDTKNTRDKNTLDNQKLCDRISPDLLDPFRNNPFTKPLTSYAYS
tara:strand:- start:191 stop:1510 length:1320 start_codon:yes stop_codon:yes gene_type:complete